MNPVNVTISVKVTWGKKRGKQLGIPTLNFSIPKTLTLPYGIYAGWLLQKDNKHQAAIHFGPRPQFKEANPSLEVYLFNNEFVKEKVNLKLQFVHFIRKIETFPSIDNMLQQITQDITEIKHHLT